MKRFAAMLADMNRTLSFALVVLSCAFCASGQAQANNKRLMTDAEYKTCLIEIETAAPKWVTTIENITPERIRRTSYADGLSLVDVGKIRGAVAEQRKKRTLSGELDLLASMQSLRELGHVLSNEQGIISGYTDSSFHSFGPELSELEDRIKNDVRARVALLEKSTCP
jgi:hypothetical protein